MLVFYTFFQISDILKRPQKFETISHLIWHLLSKRQITWEIVLNFVAFLENLNFIDHQLKYESTDPVFINSAHQHFLSCSKVRKKA
jgi:hypothetical protein